MRNFVFAIILLQVSSVCPEQAIGQNTASQQANELIEHEHGIKLILVDPGVFPVIDTDVEEMKRLFKLSHRQLEKILADEFKIREEHPTTEGFYIGSTEISRRQMDSVYRSLAGFDNYPFRTSPFAPPQRGNINEPARNFNFPDAVVFCNALSKLYSIPEYYRLTLTVKPDSDKTHVGVGDWIGIPFYVEVPDASGKGFRLPTIWEWEYACRAGADTHYYFGDNPADICDFGWIRDCKDELGRKHKFPTACAMYKPNAWGLYDMHGNVWEWCTGNLEDNRLPNVQYLKGGSIDSKPFECRSSYIRHESTSKSGIENIGFGFRIARNH